MHYQRIAAFLLGAWILGSLFMIFVATQNFASVDRVLAGPQSQQTVRTLGVAPARALLRDMAGQENQLFFVNWERAELVLGVLLAAVLLLGAGSRAQAGLSGALLILVTIQHFGVTPEMLSLSQHLDNAATADQFGKLHAIYGIMEVVKLIGAVFLAVLLLPSWRRSAIVNQVQPVDYAHHGHIDR